MVDYIRSTGATGQMMLRDLGGTVEFWLNSNSYQTWFESEQFSYSSPNGSGSWNAGYAYGGGWQRIGFINVTSNGNVSWTIPDTETYGFGGPTTQTVYITRATAPAAPTIKEIDTIRHQSFRTLITAGGNGGSAINGYQVGYGTSTTTPSDFATASGTTVQVNTNRKPGEKLYVWARAKNVVGYGAWSARKEVTLLAGVRIRVNDIWKFAIPYVKKNNAWVAAEPYIKRGGIWKKAIY